MPPAARRSSKHKPVVNRAPDKRASEWASRPGIILAVFAFCVLLFYAPPLFNANASIQWDAADLHYSFQKAVSDSIWSGHIPFWTPYEYSGMPLAADPQAGAWYPLNWPFFLMGISPRTLEWELALHAFLACLGGWLLARDLLRSHAAALMAAACYGLSGFFAAHSSHVGMFQAAALFPWLLWAYRRATISGSMVFAAGAGAIGGCIVLAGHFQTALYAFAELALFAVAEMITGGKTAIRRSVAILGITAALTLALSAVELLPGLELTRQSIRAGSDYSRQTNGSLPPAALLTLVSPNHYGAVTGPYTGPEDITQYYYYAGVLMPFLALAGLILYAPSRAYALAMAVPALWYAFGPPGGFYLLVARLPGFRSVRAPVHAWFVIALALALCAGAGLSGICARLRRRWIAAAVLMFTLGDLFYWNMDQNALAYGHSSWEQAYGAAFDNFTRATERIRQQPFGRLWSKFDSTSFGPLNGMLDSRTEATYAYNPLELSRYAFYIDTANRNPALLNGLSATFGVDPTNGALVPNPAALPRAYFPKAVVETGSEANLRARLATLNPAEQALVTALPPAITQDAHATAKIAGYRGDRYDVRYTAATPSLLRLAVPYFPGWRAEVDGREAHVLPVDEALSGVVVPPGRHELVFRYHSTWFGTGAAVSCIGLMALVGLVVFGRSKRPRQA